MVYTLEQYEWGADNVQNLLPKGNHWHRLTSYSQKEKCNAISHLVIFFKCMCYRLCTLDFSPFLISFYQFKENSVSVCSMNGCYPFCGSGTSVMPPRLEFILYLLFFLLPLAVLFVQGGN